MSPKAPRPDKPNNIFALILSLVHGLPNTLKIIFSCGLIIVMVTALWFWLRGKDGEKNKNNEPVCSTFIITGSLKDARAGKMEDLPDAKVSFENKSVLLDDAFATNGKFVVRGIKIKAEDSYLDLWVKQHDIIIFHKRLGIDKNMITIQDCTLNLGAISLDSSDMVKKPPTPGVAEKTFRTNIRNQTFIKEIEKKSGYTYSTSSSLFVEILYTGQINELDNHLYWYPGGKAMVRVGKQHCQQVIDFQIQRTLPSGNSRLFVEGELQKQLQLFVSLHDTTVTKAICECLPGAS